MNSSNYKALFKISITHSYFANGVCRGLSFTPGSLTVQLLNRFTLKYRPVPDGFEWYADTKASAESFLKGLTQASGEFYFEFDMEAVESFYSYTVMPGEGMQPLLYSSRKAKPQENGVNLLTPETVAGTGRIFGKLVIFFSDIIKLADKGLPAKFEIAFSAKQTQWQYYIINRSAIVVDNPAITGKPAVRFTGPAGVTSPSGEQAMLFTSGNTLLPLSEKPVYSFNLVSASGNNSQAGDKPPERIIYRGLPNPVPGHTGHAIGDDPGVLSSPMFVYI